MNLYYRKLNMSFIDQILEERQFISEMESYEKEVEELNEKLSLLKEQYRKLCEGPTDFPESMSVGEMFDEAQKRMKTARWALGLTNKLKNPEDKKKHRRNVITVLNQLRGLITKLTNRLTTEVSPDRERQPLNNKERGSNMRQSHPAMAT